MEKLIASEIVEVDSTSNENILKPFWNEQCAEISSKLWLPSEIDLQELGLNSFDKSLSKTVENSWFSDKLFFRQNNNLPTTCSISSTFSRQEYTNLEIIKSKSIKLSLTPEQNRLFKHWHDVSRWIFNQALNFMIIYETSEELGVKKLSWMDLKKMFTRTFTSKTYPETGEVKKVGSAKRIKLLNGQWINRDLVGARNSLLRALVDQPHLFSVAVMKG